MKKIGEITEERKAFLAKDYSRGFIRYCKFEAERIERGYFKSKVGIDESHRQQDGFIHAGVMATMADHTAGYAAFTIVPEDHQILTVEFKVNFLRPAYGDFLACRSKVIREGSQIIISESEVFDIREDESETLVAKALVTLMVVHKDKIARMRQSRNQKTIN
ncbi:MAG: PaaI family thioesterase [Desulfobacterales bacterium]|nr:PaaI family thioesterase [Desulfobacterales bacterium]